MFTQFEKRVIDIITQPYFPADMFNLIAGRIYFNAMKRHEKANS